MSDLCHSLKIKICVEGVENEESLNIIEKYLPDTVQGYHYSTPLPETDFFESFITDKSYWFLKFKINYKITVDKILKYAIMGTKLFEE